MSEERLVAADEMALQWLTSERVLPTRNLQLSFSAAHDAYSFLTDYSLVVGIIRNNPGIVPDALLSAVEGFLKSLSTAKRLAAGRYQRGARRRYYDSVAAIRGVLDGFIDERDRGLHDNDEDYSADIVARWLATSHRAKADDIAIIGSGDYLRLLARAIDHTPNLRYMRSSHLGHLAGSSREPALNKKDVVKLLKKLAREANNTSAAVPEHQDVAMFLSSGRIHVRPMSYVREARWEVGAGRGQISGVGINLLGDQSPVHSDFDEIGELEELINSTTAVEHDFQRFFESHPAFLLGTDYRKLISHPLLVRDGEENLVPDFVLVPYEFSTPKLLELKLPTVPLARHTANRQGFLQHVMTARDQLLEYRNFFSTKAAAAFARDTWGCEVFLPRMAVVIGRSTSFEDEYERRKIESRVPDLELITYDDVLERARRCRTLGYTDFSK